MRSETLTEAEDWIYMKRSVDAVFSSFEKDHLGSRPSLVLFETSTGLRGFGSSDLEEGDELVLVNILPGVSVLRMEERGRSGATYRGQVFMHLEDEDNSIRERLQKATTEEFTLV